MLIGYAAGMWMRLSIIAALVGSLPGGLARDHEDSKDPAPPQSLRTVLDLGPGEALRVELVRSGCGGKRKAHFVIRRDHRGRTFASRVEMDWGPDRGSPPAETGVRIEDVLGLDDDLFAWRLEESRHRSSTTSDRAVFHWLDNGRVVEVETCVQSPKVLVPEMGPSLWDLADRLDAAHPPRWR